MADSDRHHSSGNPIGIFDSGVGGLSVFEEIRRLLPGEDLLYVADSGYAPYGERERPFIEARAEALTRFLLARGAKALVVACNTATEMAADGLRARYTLPIVGMEPAIKTGIATTRSGVVGVLATRGTVNGHRVAALVERHRDRPVQVVLAACPELVMRVEHGLLDDDATRRAIAGRVEPLLEQGADVLVLGCTHFHFLRPAIEKVAGPAVAVIDSGAAVARQLRKRLEERDLLNPRAAGGSERFWTTGTPADASRLFTMLLGRNVGVSSLPPG